MFTSTPDALVEVSAMLRVVKIDMGNNKALITKVHQGEQTFVLTPDDCRHLAAVLLKDLPAQAATAKAQEAINKHHSAREAQLQKRNK
jgi:hypothetical protein